MRQLEEIRDLLADSKREEKKANPIVVALAIIGAIAAVAGIG